jgi:hypothetical protein
LLLPLAFQKEAQPARRRAPEPLFSHPQIDTGRRPVKLPELFAAQFVSSIFDSPALEGFSSVTPRATT